MNDYKELIGDIGDCLIGHPSEALCKRVLREAADAIERLCTDAARLEAENRAKEQYIAETIGRVIIERDEWKTLGLLANKRAEDYREMRRQRDKAIKERDAAVADLKINWLCAVCKNRVVTKEWMACKNKDFYEAPCGSPTCLNFEWRGVREVEDE